MLDDPVFVGYCRRLYLEKHTFSKAFIGDFTMGYNTSSVTESMNRLIKIDAKNKRISMADFRKQFNSSHQRAEQNSKYSDFRKQFPVNFPFVSIVPHVSITCVIEIYKNIQKFLRYSLITLDNSRFQIKHNKNLEDINTVTIEQDNIKCSCNTHILYGYPCVHMIVVLLNVKPSINCLNLINKHWLVNPNVEMNLEIDERAFFQLQNTVNISYNDELKEELSIDISLNNKKRYNKIMFMGKQLARIGSLANDEMYDKIIHDLSLLISVNSKPVNSLNDPIMAQPRKKEGKKLAKLHNKLLKYAEFAEGIIQQRNVQYLIIMFGGLKIQLGIKRRENVGCVIPMVIIMPHAMLRLVE